MPLSSAWLARKKRRNCQGVPNTVFVCLVCPECDPGNTYIIPTRRVTPHGSAGLAFQVQGWVSDRVSARKKLRGGVVAVDQIPKR